MDLALNNIQRLISHKTQQTKTKDKNNSPNSDQKTNLSRNKEVEMKISGLCRFSWTQNKYKGKQNSEKYLEFSKGLNKQVVKYEDSSNIQRNWSTWNNDQEPNKESFEQEIQRGTETIQIMTLKTSDGYWCVNRLSGIRILQKKTTY